MFHGGTGAARLQPGAVVLALWPMAGAVSDEGALIAALEQAEAALDRLEAAVAARSAQDAELAALRARHRRLKDSVAGELRQLDLLLANLPQE